MTPWSTLSIVSLIAAAVGICAPSVAVAADIQTHCHSAGLALGAVGSERLQHYDDGHGHEIELWCVKGVFNAHYDLRIGWNERTPAPDGTVGVVHRFRTIAGCFFNHGHNTGPDISSDAGGAFSQVVWTNESPSEGVTYRFSYDYAVGRVTVTVATPCHAPVSKVVDPQDSFGQLDDLLPDPPGGACSSTASGTPVP